MFKTDYTRIPSSVALRCGWNGPVYGPALRFTPWRWVSAVARFSLYTMAAGVISGVWPR